MNDVSVDATRHAIKIELFGGFRQFRSDSTIAVELEPEATVADIRARLADIFADDARALSLLKASAFATNARVLDEDERVPLDADLALLPPVCGG